MRRQQFLSTCAGIAVAIGLSIPASAQAQSAAANEGTAAPAATSEQRDIVVTARRRAESAQSVPVSITALGREALETRSVRSLDDLTKVSPGLRFAGEGNSNVSAISLRGLSKIAASSTGTPAVVVYFSDVPLPGEGLALPTFDLSSVQVLKGPQGTLFGRNTIGGAVLVTPEAPSYTLGGYGRVSFGNLDYKSVEGALNVPIVEDRVALRLAGQIRRRDGFVTELQSGSELMNVHQDAFRASLLVEPVDGLTNTTVYDHFKGRDNGTADIIFRINQNIPGLEFVDAFVAEEFQAQQSRGIYSVNSAVDDLFTRIETWGITNTTELEISDQLTLKNIFGYRENQLETRGNNDALGPNPTGFVFYKTLHSFNNDRQISNELQLQGTVLDDKLDFIAGGFYLKFQPDGNRGNMQNQFNSVFATSSYVTIETKAAFAQVGYDLSSLVEGLKLNVGGRYTWTDQEACGTTNFTVADIDDFNSQQQCYANAQQGGLGRAILNSSEERLTWTFGLDYQLTPDVFLYGVTRRGFREGGINGPLFNSPAALAFGLDRFQTYDPEIVTDLEVGAKVDWTAGSARGRLNVSAFRNWYDNAVNYINVTGFVPVDDPSFPDRGSFGFNAADLTISGVEVDGNISPTPGIVFSFSGTYLDQKVKSVTTVDPFPPVSVTLPSPEFSYSLAADFTPQEDVLGGILTLHFDYFWMDDYQVQSGPFPGYDLANARLDLREIGGTDISVGLFARNLFDNEYLVSPVIALPTFPTNVGNPGEPRTYGVDVSFKF